MAKIKSLSELKDEILNNKKEAKVKENKEEKNQKKEETQKSKEKIELAEEKELEDKKYIQMDEEEIRDEIIKKVSKEINIPVKNVRSVLDLIDEGNTIPFIARYRKDQTGNLDDETLRSLEEVLKKTTNLYVRKDEVLRLIDESGNLTEEIIEEVKKADSLSKIEDIYRPFKGKRKTRGSEAKRKGLEKLSIALISQKYSMEELEKMAKDYINDEVKNEEEALSGASDIIAENISNDINIRENLRNMYLKEALFTSVKKDKAEDEKEIYKVYYDFSQLVSTLPSHRILGVLRGEKENILNVKIEIEKEKALDLILKKVLVKDSKIKEKIREIVEDAQERLIHPSLEREIKNILKERADESAINIFKVNLKELLLLPPIQNLNILGLDPGYKAGCKWAVINETGKPLDWGVIYPTLPKKDIKTSTKVVKDLINKWDIKLISIGNGTASRETEEFVSDIIKDFEDVSYLITNEAGASVYSASKVATEEFPDINVVLRGAISIARRVQDPMAELVKIDPKSIGVGQYQHDVDQKKLQTSLNSTIEDVVNKVGVDLNTATYMLLSHIAGLKTNTAKNIVKFRNEKGSFTKREQLKKVSGIGDVSYNQAVGFLRIYGGENIFDETGIHPEVYKDLEKILKENNFTKEDLRKENKREKLIKILKENKEEIIKEKNIGKITLEDIIKELEKPGRDIRTEAPPQELKKGIVTFEDIKIGEVLKGTVRNVVAFGAFIDIGIENDGLVHISELSKKFVKDPNDVVKVGDVVKVKVIDKNDKTEKVSLSMKIDE